MAAFGDVWSSNCYVNRWKQLENPNTMDQPLPRKKGIVMTWCGHGRVLLSPSPGIVPNLLIWICHCFGLDLPQGVLPAMLLCRISAWISSQLSWRWAMNHGKHGHVMAMYAHIWLSKLFTYWVICDAYKYVYIYIYIYVYIYIYIYAHTYRYIYIYTYICVYANVYA